MMGPHAREDHLGSIWWEDVVSEVCMTLELYILRSGKTVSSEAACSDMGT